MGFAEIAAQRGITTATFDGLTFEVDADGYQRLKVDLDPPPPIEALWKLLPRRHLDPAVMPALFAVYPARPIERALIAYDIVTSSLLGPGDPTFADELAPLRGIANVNAAVPHDQLAKLIAAITPAAPDELPSLADAQTVSLDDLEPIYAHARLLAKAHLHSLAIAFLQIVVDRGAPPRALELLVEFALDGDQILALPPFATQPLQTYLLARMAVASFEMSAGEKLVANATDLSSTLVRAQLATMQLQTFDDPALVAQIADAAPGWRYAQAVAFGVAADRDSVAWRLESYVSSWGDDPWVWAQAALIDNTALYPLLSQELRYASFVAAVWRALSIVLEKPEIDNEVHARITVQLAAAFEPAVDQGWPRFADPQPLADGRTWTARLESYDQHYENIYYWITITETGVAAPPFIGQLSAPYENIRESLREGLAGIAASGVTNTEYRGYGIG
ncbi:MAG: hypothetical protein QM831_31905 [Kofleriaceae bacterium]